MGSKTKIEWTDATWSPSRGCSKVSAGCAHCYAEVIAARFSHTGGPYNGVVSGGRWNGQIHVAEHLIKEPLKWKKPRRIFVSSMTDLFHEKMPFEKIDEIFETMRAAHWHTFQVLTKRPERMLEWFNHYERDKFVIWPLPNVWVGVSTEDQKTADERIPILLKVPATVRFVSAEPLLGPINFNAIPRTDNAYFMQRGETGVLADKSEPDDYVYWNKKGISQVIVGGESGPDARKMDPDWARSIRDQCVAAGVPFFFKQYGAGPKIRTLDGVEWNQFPE